MDYINEFKAAMQAAGFETRDIIAADDAIHRLRVNGERSSSMSYRLAINQDGAVGWFKSFKDGILHKYHSRAENKNLTPEEIEQARQRRKEAQRKRDAEIAKVQDDMAKQAVKFWQSLPKADGSDAYSKRKRITPKDARWFKGGKLPWYDYPIEPCLVVPIYNSKGLRNLQLIGSEFKLFLPGAQLTGCYGAISTAPPQGEIWVAEGYATARTVADALACPVLVAFNAGNLKPVADAIGKKYPDCAVYIAADNDHVTEANGKGNTGIIKAKESGYNYSAPPAEGGITDWNDYACKHGLQAAKEALVVGLGSRGEALLASQAEPPESPATDSDDWMSQLKYTDKGGLVKNNLHNLSLYLRNHRAFKNRFWYDEFHREVMIRWDGRVCPINDEFVTQLCIEAENMDLNKNFDIINKMILMIAKERSANPAKMYFDKLQWDGKTRLNTWLSYYFGAEDEPDEYLAFIGKKWLTAAVKRIYEPGCKFDHVLVMEGEQSLGKSTALRELATFGEDGKSYCTDQFSFMDIGDKDGVRKTNGNIIVELAEMVGHNKKETEDIKRWITMQEDIARFAFARHIQRFPRMFVLACTTNDYEYLRDPTGNRRYWPFVVKSIDIKALKQDRIQLWAEAVYHYKSGLYIGPTPEEQELAKIEQAKRIESDPWEDAVKRALDDVQHRPFTTGEIMAGMSMQLREKDHQSKRRIGAILSSMGYSHKARWDAELCKTVRAWQGKQETTGESQ